MGLILHYFIEFVYDVVVKQFLDLSQFQILLLIVMTILIPSVQLFSDYLGKTNSGDSV